MWAAFRRPNSIQTKLNSPNGVMTAVLGTSDGSTGIMSYARTRYTFEKILAPCNVGVKSWICGTGYLSRIVALFNVWKSPQVRQSPAVFLGTMWRREAKLLDDGLIIPGYSICWNSCLAIFSHSRANHQGSVCTGGP